jgi:hypothetical protein
LSCATACRTFRCTSSDTGPLLFSARETVINPTPANLATSCIRALGNTLTFHPETQNPIRVASTGYQENPNYTEMKIEAREPQLCCHRVLPYSRGGRHPCHFPNRFIAREANLMQPG